MRGIESTAVTRLLSLGGRSIASEDPKRWLQLVARFPNAAQLGLLYREKNGFHAFESAFVCLPIGATPYYPGLFDLTLSPPWRKDASSPAHGGLIFALNGLSEIFCLLDKEIIHVDLQGDRALEVWPDVETFCSDLVENFELHTAYTLVHAWQEQNGPLPLGHLLIPITPFVFGGEYSHDNLAAVPSSEAIDHVHNLGIQLRGLEDGESVMIEVRP